MWQGGCRIRHASGMPPPSQTRIQYQLMSERSLCSSNPLTLPMTMRQPAGKLHTTGFVLVHIPSHPILHPSITAFRARFQHTTPESGIHPTAAPSCPRESYRLLQTFCPALRSEQHIEPEFTPALSNPHATLTLSNVASVWIQSPHPSPNLASVARIHTTPAFHPIPLSIHGSPHSVWNPAQES